MKARIDHSKCQSHYVCNLMAPTIFLVGEESDYPLVADEDLDEGQLDIAQRAALSCPEKAIIIE